MNAAGPQRALPELQTIMTVRSISAALWNPAKIVESTHALEIYDPVHYFANPQRHARATLDDATDKAAARNRAIPLFDSLHVETVYPHGSHLDQNLVALQFVGRRGRDADTSDGQRRGRR